MTKKSAGILLTLAALATGAWLGWRAWRAHSGLVTLDMRNAPVAEVVRAVERQTWERVMLDTQLRARVTIQVKNAPLAHVLDLIAAKAGGRWRKTYVVYNSGDALAGLELAITGGQKLDAAVWTNLAPDLSGAAFPGVAGPGGHGPGGPPPGASGGAWAGSGGSGQGGVGTRVSRNGSGNARMATMLPDGTVDHWSSERLVLENDLAPKLSGPPPEEANEATASQTAAAVHGRRSTFYELARAPFAGGGGGRRFRFARGGGGGPAKVGDVAAEMTNMRRDQRLRDLSYSPEEQVERARGHGARKIQIEDTEEPK